jgi:hypothetical protein
VSARNLSEVKCGRRIEPTTEVCSFMVMAASSLTTYSCGGRENLNTSSGVSFHRRRGARLGGHSLDLCSKGRRTALARRDRATSPRVDGERGEEIRARRR